MVVRLPEATKFTNGQKVFASEVAHLAIVLICSGQENQIVIQNYQGKREFFNLMTKCIYEIEYESQGIDVIHLKNTETTYLNLLKRNKRKCNRPLNSGLQEFQSYEPVWLLGNSC